MEKRYLRRRFGWLGLGVAIVGLGLVRNRLRTVHRPVVVRGPHQRGLLQRRLVRESLGFRLVVHVRDLGESRSDALCLTDTESLVFMCVPFFFNKSGRQTSKYLRGCNQLE